MVVVVRKGSYTTLNIVKDTENLGEERENLKNLANEKRSSEILAVKMEIFSDKNVIQKFWLAKNVCVPPKLGARSPPLVSALNSGDAMHGRPDRLDSMPVWMIDSHYS